MAGKAILVRLSPEVHRDLRVAAARQGTTVTKVVRDLLHRWLRREARHARRA